MRGDFEEVEKKDDKRWHGDIVELTEKQQQQMSWSAVWKVGNQLQWQNSKCKTAKSCLSVSVNEYISWDSDDRQTEQRQTVAHLTSEVTDTLACLQDGHLHVLCGLFGMGRLLLRWDRERKWRIKYETQHNLQSHTHSVIWKTDNILVRMKWKIHYRVFVAWFCKIYITF